MGSTDVLETLRRIGALKKGHFLLASGRHSDHYVEKFDLLRLPAETQLVCAAVVERFGDRQIDVVVGPTTGGMLLAFEVARQMGCPAAYAERRTDDTPGREIRRGTTFRPGARVLVVDDILTTGGSVQETLHALAQHDVEVVAVAVLVDRSAGGVQVDVPLIAMASLSIDTYLPEHCELCARGMPLLKPGTTTTT